MHLPCSIPHIHESIPVVDFAKKVEAERVLGVRRVRPNKLHYIRQSSWDEDFGEI